MCKGDDCLSWSRGGVVGGDLREVGAILQGVGGRSGESRIDYPCSKGHYGDFGIRDSC